VDESVQSAGMRVIVDAPPSLQYGGRFSGRVELAMLEEATADSRPDVARVRFCAGAVTNWHSHPGGQLLLLLDGVGRVGNDHATYPELAPGAFVSADADDRHWHGAAAGADCVWLTITWGTTRWEEHGPDDQSA
jgi:quercetin dioxygenase-like cupin family protein